MGLMSELGHDQLPESWSTVAAGYDASFAGFTGPYGDEALRLLGSVDGRRVLDVAAGSGAFSLRAARLGAEVTATDFAPGMVEFLRERFASEGLDRCTTDVMDGQALDLADDTFDFSASMFGVFFFPDMDRGLRELVRVTRPGGQVCVSVWRLEGFRLSQLVGEALARAIPGFDGERPDPPWARIGDEAGLRDALGGVGLDPVDVHTVTHEWAWDDPAEFFRRMPDWSPPIQPLFEALDIDAVDAAAQAFVELIDEADGPAGGIAVDALVGIGTKP